MNKELLAKPGSIVMPKTCWVVILLFGLCIDAAMAPVQAGSLKQVSVSRAGTEAIFDDLPVIGEQELGAMRGGVRVAGMDIAIGANVRTLFDGRLAMETLINLTGRGPEIRSITTGSGLTVVWGGAGSSLRDVVPPTVDLAGLEGSQGVILNDAQGFTAALQDIGRERILSVLVNQATGRRIDHQVNVDIMIYFARDKMKLLRISGKR